MKPAPFGYHLASSVDEATAILAAYEGTARPIAGGQSLVPMLNMRLMQPDALVDLGGIRPLHRMDVGPETAIIGAMTRYTTVERSEVLRDELPLLAEVVRHVGDRQVRNRGTVGGSLSHGDPTAEVPLACLTLGATVRVSGPAGHRDIPMQDLYETAYASTLEPGEVLTEVTIPLNGRHFGFVECCRRHNDFAVVSVACTAKRDDDGRWTGIRIGLGGVADVPVLADSAAAVVEGTELSDGDIESAGAAALEAIDPPSDIRASAEYRRHLVPIYVRRALQAMRGRTEER